MPVIADNLPGHLCTPGDVLHLRDELEDPEVAPGYWVLLEVIGYYAAICPAGEDEEDGALCRGGERVTIPAEELDAFVGIGVRVAVE
jgi:hypothetical protein